MPFKSKFPDLDIPETNILNIVFPKNDPIDPNKPIWSDSDDPKNHITKKQALHSIKKFAIALDHLNVKPQQTVMIFTPNHINVPIVYMGIVGSRRIFSGANPVYTQSEVEYQLRDTDAKLLLVHPSLLDTGLAAAQKVGIPRHRIFQFSDKPTAQNEGIADWNDILGSDEEAGKYEWPALSGSEARKTIASINYSSGTTGLPKGVMVSHYNVIANVMQTIYMRDLEMPYDPARRPEERWLAFLPLYHAYGQLWTCLIAPRLGIDVYVMKKFDFLGFLEGVQKYRVTHLQVAPPVVVMLGRRPETKRYDLSSVKYILCGAAPLAKDLQNEVCDLLKVSITQGWGMTETTSAAIHVPGGANDDSGSVGMLDPNTEAKLVDDDGREVVGIGEPGELYVRGPQMCMGYWKNEAATKETLDSDGWLRTGDVAKVNSKEWFWIVDRKKVRNVLLPYLKTY